MRNPWEHVPAMVIQAVVESQDYKCKACGGKLHSINPCKDFRDDGKTLYALLCLECATVLHRGPSQRVVLWPQGLKELVGDLDAEYLQQVVDYLKEKNG